MANNCNKTFRDLINDGQAQVLGIVSIVPMGDWNGTTTYQKLNYVRHNGATYLAKVANNNVEPGVAANWEDVWMLCNYDGGLVVPDGTYPDLTAGQVLYPLSFGSKTYNGSSAQTVTAADLGVASAYIPQGSITFANLPSTPSAATLSYVWDISDQFTTDSRFIEGAGQTYSAGTNVGVIEQNGNYYYDVFGSFVDLSNYAQINGTYSGMTVGAATKATQDGNGDNIANTYAKQSGTYPNMTVGNASNAVNATKATQDGSGNNIASTYAKKSELNVKYTHFLSNSGLTSLVSSGYMDLYKIGKIIICTFSLTLNKDVSTWGTAMIFSFNTHSEFTPVPSQDKLIGTGMQSLSQGGQVPIEIIVNPSGIFVGGDSNKISKDMHLCGQVVYAIA